MSLHSEELGLNVNVSCTDFLNPYNGTIRYSQQRKVAGQWLSRKNEGPHHPVGSLIRVLPLFASWRSVLDGEVGDRPPASPNLFACGTTAALQKKQTASALVPAITFYAMTKTHRDGSRGFVCGWKLVMGKD